LASDSRFWLVRHAPVLGPPGVIHGPEAPANLDCVSALESLEASLPRGALAVCSPAARTRQTAAALGLEAQVIEGFREQNFGTWTGRRHADLETELGPDYAAFWRSPAVNRAPGGESFKDQISRVRTAIATLAAGDNVVVAHSGTVRAMLCIALEMAPIHALRFVIDPLSLTRIDRLAGGWRVGCVNRPTSAR
jgi:alpha-ribazole phosphatase